MVGQCCIWDMEQATEYKTNHAQQLASAQNNTLLTKNIHTTHDIKKTQFF